MKYANVVIGYNRLPGIERLLNSLLEVNYYGEKIDLIISLDCSDNKELHDYVKSFLWPFGEKKLRIFEERQGLKKHILSCGEFLKDYDAVAVFEDDVFVSPSYYSFMRETVPFYKDDSKIAGISLYTHTYNVNARYPFMPEETEYDVFFMQFAQSWGQIWLKEPFQNFLKWVKEGNYVFDATTSEFVNGWPDKSSWLKLHVKYCVDNNLFFVYPYRSLTTCYSDVGEHIKRGQNLQQVSLLSTPNAKDFRLTKLTGNSVRYDSYFERVIDDDVLVDIYGVKQLLYGKYNKVLTTNKLDYEIIDSFAYELKPHEMNYINKIKGEDIFLYDLTKKKRNKISKNVELKRFEYYYQIQHRYKTIPGVFITKVLQRLKGK